MLEMLTHPNLRWSAAILPCGWKFGIDSSTLAFIDLCLFLRAFMIKYKNKKVGKGDKLIKLFWMVREKSKRVIRRSARALHFSQLLGPMICVFVCLQSVQKPCHFESPKLDDLFFLFLLYGIVALLGLL